MVVDQRRVSETSGERVVFNHLRKQGFFDGFERKRILEIGPKHGKDSVLLATLNPSELVLVDLPEKESMVREWLPQVSCKCKTTYFEGNILYMTQEQYSQLGTFDLVWCLGVLYHNVEQFRLLKRLFDLCNVNGSLVIESATTRNKRLEKSNVVEIHWPDTYRNVQTITHLPSRLAIKSWLEMVGFVDVKIWNIYSREFGWQRAVLTGKKTSKSKPYISYAASGLNPIYVAGDAK
jgi:tRNA (mo5U34)-methyltransferase